MLKKYIICSTILFCSHELLADNNYAYLDIGAGASFISPLPNPAFDLSLNAGYQFNKNLALEAQWSGQPSFQWNNYLLNNYNVYSVATKGIIPFNSGFSLYGKLGLGGAFSSWSGTPDTSASSIYATDGGAWSVVIPATVGMSYRVNQALSIYLENNNYVPIGNHNGAFGYTNATVFGFSINFGNVNNTQPIEMAHAEPPVVNSLPQPASSLITPTSVLTIAGGDSQIYIESSVADSSLATDKSVLFTTPVTINVMPARTSSTTKNDTECTDSNFSCSDIKRRLIRQADGSSYIVAIDGDTLYKYVVAFKVDLDKLRQLNNLNGNTIVIGSRVYIYESTK